MKRIDGAGHVGNRFVSEDTATSRPPTEITAEWLNGVQEEMCNLITGAGLVLDGASNNQLNTAVRALISAAVAGSIGGTIDANSVGGYLPSQLWREDSVDFNASESGSLKFPPDGAGRRLMLQWGPLPAVGGSVDITFSVPFTNICFHVDPTVDSDTDDATLFRAFARNRTRFGFQLFTGGINMRGGSYMAIGF